MDDHVFLVVKLMKGCSEFQTPLWVRAVDFEKAFDTVSHVSFLNAFDEQRVPWAYNRTLAGRDYTLSRQCELLLTESANRLKSNEERSKEIQSARNCSIRCFKRLWPEAGMLDEKKMGGRTDGGKGTTF